MDKKMNYPEWLDVFLKNSVVWVFFSVLVFVYIAWHGFFYVKSMAEVREASGYFYAKNYAEAYQKIQPLAMNGYSESRYQLGVMTAFGLGPVRKDKMLAMFWFNCKDISGCVEGRNEYRLALGCLQGEWGERREEECLWWMKSSAELQYQDALVWLDKYNSKKNGKEKE